MALAAGPAGGLGAALASSLHALGAYDAVVGGRREERDEAQRTLLFDLDMSIVRLTRDAPGHAALVSLTGCYHNLLRMWAEV